MPEFYNVLLDSLPAQGLKRTVKVNQLQNSPITVAGIDRVDAICGPQVAILKGKFV